jgi:multiple sugar transport system permease protein
LFGAMAGYALARLRPPGRNLIFLVFLGSLMIPSEVGVVPLFIAMLRIGWASTYQALILPTIANVLSVYIFRQFFLTFPRELEESALVDGAGVLRIFFRDAVGTQPADRRDRDCLYSQLEQLPVAAAHCFR